MKKFFYTASVTFLFLFTLTLIGTGNPLASEGSPSWEVKLTAGDPTANADFGRSVAVGNNHIAVGAGSADAGPVPTAGAVYLFKRQGLGYVPEAKLIAPDATSEQNLDGPWLYKGVQWWLAPGLLKSAVYRKQGPRMCFERLRIAGTWKPKSPLRPRQTRTILAARLPSTGIFWS